MLFGRDGMSGEGEEVDVTAGGTNMQTHCAVLEESHLGMLLTVGAVRQAGLSPARLRALVRGHVAADRPRAACLNVIGEAQRSSAQLPLAACAVRLGWSKIE